MDGTRVVLGAPVHCTGNVVGEIADVLVDPAASIKHGGVDRRMESVGRQPPAFAAASR